MIQKRKLVVTYRNRFSIYVVADSFHIGDVMNIDRLSWKRTYAVIFEHMHCMFSQLLPASICLCKAFT